jgi:hypothetical protein
MRDARIAAIYEGTNGIQAIDLVQRKLPLSGGAAVAREIGGIRAVAAYVASHGGDGFGATAQRLREAADALESATASLRETLARDPDEALAGATPYLRLFALALGGACLAKAGLAAQSAPRRAGGTPPLGRVALARFFAEKLATAAPGLAQTVLSGGAALEAHEAALQEFA